MAPRASLVLALPCVGPAQIFVGTAGWSISRMHAAAFPGAGTHLERYARIFTCVEIDSSFYRPHRPETYERWACSTPADFRFAVKVPRTITHDARLSDAEQPLRRFLAETARLGGRLGPLLIQLPPSLPFDPVVAARFFGTLREAHRGAAVCEPRHAGWFVDAAERLLEEHRIARVAADPPPAAGAERFGGWPGIAYLRLHGSPRRYWSVYGDAELDAWALRVRALPGTVEAWCILDNTAGGGALGNALAMRRRLEHR